MSCYVYEWLLPLTLMGSAATLVEILPIMNLILTSQFEKAHFEHLSESLGKSHHPVSLNPEFDF